MSDRPESTDGLPTRWRSKGLFTGLLRSHLSLVALGSAGFLVALVALFALEERMNRALNLSEPLVEETLAAIEGVYAAGGAVNGVVALKRGSYRQEWIVAWDGVIDPAIGRLESGVAEQTLMTTEEWRALRRGLRDLHEAQWWVFDMVGLPGEEPARYLMSERIRPVSREIEGAITSLIENLSQQDGLRRNARVLKRLADLRYRFTRSVTHLENFIAMGLSPAENDFHKDIATVENELALLPEGNVKSETALTTTHIKRLYPHYLAMAKRAITLRKGEGWSVTRELLQAKVRPLELEVLDRLSHLRRKAIARAAETADEAMGAANGVIAFSAGFVVLLALVGFFLSTLHASRIAAPVTALMGAARRFAKGEKVGDVTPEGYEETVELAGAFNAMRRAVVQKEEDLARSEYRLRALMDQAGDAIIIAARDGHLLEANQEALRLLNREVADISTMNFRDIHPPETHEALRDEFAAMWEGGSVRVDDTFLISSDGVRTPVSISARIIDVGGEKVAQGIFRDMTQVKAAEGRAELFRRMVDQAQEIILMVDPDEGRILYGNLGAARILGYDHENLPNVPLQKIVVVDHFEAWWREIIHAANEGKGHPHEVALKQKTGGLFPAELTVQLSDASGERYALVLARNIAERLRHVKLQEVARSLEQANRELKDFNAVVSHDLQSPLTTIIGFSHRLINRLGDRIDDRELDYLRRIDGAAQRMSGLISDLLEYSWAGGVSTKGEEIELTPLLNGLVSDMAGTIDQCGGYVEIGQLPSVYGDATLLRQAFQNLIGNGLKYQRDGVPPRVTIAYDPACDQADRITVVVKDNGIGFDDTQADRIFKVFERLPTVGKYKGTGLGLATTRKIVERHGGTISATAVPGEGATFYVTLTSVADYS